MTPKRNSVVSTRVARLGQHLAQALRDVRAGRVHGPFKSVDEMLISLRKRKTKVRRHKPS